MTRIDRQRRGGRARTWLVVLLAGGALAAGGVGVATLAQSGGGDGSSGPAAGGGSGGGSSARGDSRGGRAPGSATDQALAQRTSFDIVTTVTGELQARNQIELFSELESESAIVEIVPEGTMVRRGDLLVRLNGDQIQTQLDEVRLRVESARAEMVAAENGYRIQLSENDSRLRQAMLKVDLAELDLKQWMQGERVQKLKDIELDLDRTAKDLARLEEKFGRSEALFRQGFLSKDELQRDEIALREARAARAKAELSQVVYNQYQEPRDRKTKESAVEEAKAELERVKQQNEIQLVSKDAERVNRKRQLQLQVDRQTKLERQLAATEIRAPQDGLVVYATSVGRNWGSDNPFTAGRRVSPRETLIVLPDTSVMVAAVRVPEAIAGRVRVGQPATVRVDKLPGQVFTGRVDSIGILAETQDRWRDPNRREYTVRVLLDDAKGNGEVALRPSDRVEASIVLGRVEDAVAVPLQAVFSEDRLQYVWVSEGRSFVRRPVQIGRRSDTMAEVRAGLEAGTAVLLREPSVGERINRPWNESQLQTVGFRINDEGRVEPIPGQGGPGMGGGGMAGPGMGGMPPGVRSRGGPPGGAAGAAGQGRPGARPGAEQPATTTPSTTTPTTTPSTTPAGSSESGSTTSTAKAGSETKP